MDSFIFSTRLWCAGFAFLLTLSVPAASQDRNSLFQRCLSIADVNERVDCLETGVALDSGAASASNANPGRQPRTTPSFDCRVARSSPHRIGSLTHEQARTEGGDERGDHRDGADLQETPELDILAFAANRL